MRSAAPPPWGHFCTAKPSHPLKLFQKMKNSLGVPEKRVNDPAAEQAGIQQGFFIKRDLTSK